MDFRTATDEVYRVEQNAREYSSHKQEKYEAERLLELSPPDINEMEYVDAVSQYKRVEKIISASHMDEGLFGEGAEAARPAARSLPSPEKVGEVEQEMKKISLDSAREAAKFSAPLPKVKSELGVSSRLPIPSSPEEREALEPEAVEEPPAGEAAPPKERKKPPKKAPKEVLEKPQEKPEAEAEEEIEIQKVVEEARLPGEPAPEEEAGGISPEFEEKPEEAPREAPEAPEEAAAPEAGEAWEIPLGGEEAAKAPPRPPEPEAPAADIDVPFGFEELPDEAAPAARPSAPGMDTLTPSIRIPVPAFLSESPEEKAEGTIARIETQLGAQMKGKKTKKVDTADTKKRMLELTRELFKERSMNRRAEIKKEIVMLKDLLSQSRKTGKAETGGLPEGAMYSALRSAQEYEFKEALDRVQEIYEENQKVLVSAMDAQRAVEHREQAFEAFSKNMAGLEQGLDSLVDKYQSFLVKKHLAELGKLEERNQSTKDSEKSASSLEAEYSREFSSLKSTVGEQIHSQIETTRAVLFEAAGDPEAMKLSQITNASEENLFNFLQANDSRTYEKYARGEITRAEALASARRLMAIDAGVDEDTINKSFGSK